MLEIVKGYLKKREVKFKEDIPTRDLCTLKIGGLASIVAEPLDYNQLAEVVAFLESNKIEYKIVGRMSNILPRDERYEGVIVRTVRLCDFSALGHRISVGAGEMLPSLAHKLADTSLDGLCELSGIPGTLGGAIACNAGAFGREIGELVESVLVYDRIDGGIVSLLQSELSFSYRKSVFSEGRFILLLATLNLCQGERTALLKRITELKSKRLATQPTEPSAGSVFKRSGEHIPSMLIDKCGLKGRRVGGCVISEKHAGFIVNRESATAEDFKCLAKIAEDEVFSRYGVRLQREVEYL